MFVFAAVPAATYSVKVELQSFSSWEATDIVMRLGERRHGHRHPLNVGTLSETVSGGVASRDRADGLGREERAPDLRADPEHADGRTHRPPNS